MPVLRLFQDKILADLKAHLTLDCLSLATIGMSWLSQRANPDSEIMHGTPLAAAAYLVHSQFYSA